MKEKSRKIIKYILTLVLIAGIVMAGYSVFQSQKSAEAYEDAAQLANIPEISAEPTEAETETAAEEEKSEPEEILTYDWQGYMAMMKQINLEALEEINEDVIGWISIPNTQISYPVMGGAGNSYYLNHTWKKESNSSGAIFAEERNSLDFKDHNTILYGHRMRNGSMFGSLKEYQKQEYWEEHPEIFVRVGEECYRYEVFAAYEASVTGLTYQVGFADEESKQEFLDDCIKSSVIATGVIPTAEDRILTLSTCTGRGYATRWVVQARLAETE